MEELIHISERAGQQVVSARDLHAFLESRAQFSDWIKGRITKYDFVEGQDYTTYSENYEKGRPSIEYALTLDTAKELAMVEGNNKGKEARRYFIQCEKSLKGQSLQASPSELIVMLAQRNVESERRIKALEEGLVQVQAQLETRNTTSYTIMGYARLRGVRVAFSEAQRLGIQAKQKSAQMGLPVGKVSDPKFGQVNTYEVEVLEAVFNINYNLGLTA